MIAHPCLFPSSPPHSCCWRGGRTPPAILASPFSCSMLLALLPTMVALMPKFGVLPANPLRRRAVSHGWPFSQSVWAVGFRVRPRKVWSCGGAWYCSAGRNAIRSIEMHGRGSDLRSSRVSAARSPQGFSGKLFSSPTIGRLARRPTGKSSSPMSLPTTAGTIRSGVCASRSCARCTGGTRSSTGWRAAIHCNPSVPATNPVLRHGTDAKAYASVLCDFAEAHSPNPLSHSPWPTPHPWRNASAACSSPRNKRDACLSCLAILGVASASPSAAP